MVGGVLLGMCGGFQMLCRRIEDTVECGRESGRESVEGLGLLDADIVFAPEKVLARWDAATDGLEGYEIHHGRVVRCAEETWFEAGGAAQGWVRGTVFGTHWHGLFDNDGFRRDWLQQAAQTTGRAGFAVAPDISVGARRDAQLDVMADLLSAHLALDAVLDLLAGPPAAAPVISTSLVGLP